MSAHDARLNFELNFGHQLSDRVLAEFVLALRTLSYPITPRDMEVFGECRERVEAMCREALKPWEQLVSGEAQYVMACGPQAPIFWYADDHRRMDALQKLFEGAVGSPHGFWIKLKDATGAPYPNARAALDAELAKGELIR